MKYFLIICICMTNVVGFTPVKAQENGAVSGRVFMPVVKKERRTFRGRLYRNRLAAKKNISRSNEALKTSFIDVIISAHPISQPISPEPMEGVKVIQKNAEFIPRVIPITPGTIVQFINRDRFFHNVFSITPGSKFNIGRKPTNWIATRQFDKLGEIKLFCDIHAQMNATILCLDTPYFTRVEPNGRFFLKDLPPGEYELKTYHPDVPSIREIISIEAGQTVQKNYNLSR